MYQAFRHGARAHLRFASRLLRSRPDCNRSGGLGYGMRDARRTLTSEEIHLKGGSGPDLYTGRQKAVASKDPHLLKHCTCLQIPLHLDSICDLPHLTYTGIMPHAAVILINGFPGVGKGAVAEALAYADSLTVAESVR